MKMIVLMKRIPDLVEDLEVDASGKALDHEHLKLTLNEFDDYALEEALLLKEGSGGEVTVVALEGGEEVDKMLFTALAKGADRALKVAGAGAVSGNRRLAEVFSRVVAGREWDLVLTGVQAADDRDGQLGPMVAAHLDAPCVEVVTHIAAGDGGLTLHKEYSGGVVAELEVDLPAVVGVQAARQAPRYAPVSKVRQIQQTASIETLSDSGGGEGPELEILVMTPPETGEGAQMLEDVEELVKVLEAKGVL